MRMILLAREGDILTEYGVGRRDIEDFGDPRQSSKRGSIGSEYTLGDKARRESLALRRPSVSDKEFETGFDVLEMTLKHASIFSE